MHLSLQLGSSTKDGITRPKPGYKPVAHFNYMIIHCNKQSESAFISLVMYLHLTRTEFMLMINFQNPRE